MNAVHRKEIDIYIKIRKADKGKENGSMLFFSVLFY